MAGAGYKLFNTGDVLTAAQVNTYLNEQTVMVFASSAARTTALSGVLAEGMVSYLQDTNTVEFYNGSVWTALASGDVTEVQAGTGISVASGTGPIPVVTNTMATAINAAGDLIYGTANDTFTRLGIGTAGQVLQVNSGATAPEWATAASGGGYTSIASGSFSGASVSITGISGTYRDIVFIWRDFYFVNDDHMTGYVNGTTGIYTNQVVGNGDAPMTTTYFVPTQNESTDNTDQNNFLMMRFYDYANTSSHKIVDSWVIQRNTANTNYRLLNTTTAIRLTAAINSITFGTQTGANISGGTYAVFGVK